MRGLAAALAAFALAGLLTGCMAASFNYLGAAPVSNPPDSPGSTAGQVVSATPARLPPESIPPYFLALTSPMVTVGSITRPLAVDITVRASFTGQVLAVVRPPGWSPDTFTFVSAATSDGRTFLVWAQPRKPIGFDDSYQPVSFYLLRFDPASRRTSVTPLAVPTASLAEGTTTLVSAALSPDGTRLTVAEVEPGGACSTCTSTRCQRAAPGRPGR